MGILVHLVHVGEQVLREGAHPAGQSRQVHRLHHLVRGPLPVRDPDLLRTMFMSKYCISAVVHPRMPVGAFMVGKKCTLKNNVYSSAVKMPQSNESWNFTIQKIFRLLTV
jgi:hypothetical protein